MSGTAPARLLAAGLAVLACALLAAACGDDADASAIEVSNARARFTTTDVGAVYLDIRSTGAGDRLVAASADLAAEVQVHEVVREGGSSRMRPVTDGITVAAGGRVSLEPGGYHLMLLGVAEVPEAGDTFTLALQFERAGRVTVTVTVEAFGE